MIDTLDLQIKQKNDEQKGRNSQLRSLSNNSLANLEGSNSYKVKDHHQDQKVYERYQKILN